MKKSNELEETVKVDIQINHRSLSCSTLIMGCFQEWHASDTEKFSKSFFEAAFEAESEDTYEDNDGDTYAMLSGYRIEDFAFIVASTSHTQPKTEAMLEKLGCFQKTERIHKKKNPDNECIFWMAPVHKVIEELKKYDTDGYKLYAHQNEDIVRLTPAELKAKMAAKERGAG